MANDAYLLLGAYVDGAPADGVAQNDLPPGSLPGDVAQKALVAYTMAVTVERGDVRSRALDRRPKPSLSSSWSPPDDPTYNPAMDTVTPDPYAAPDNGILALLDLAGVSIP